MSVKVLLFGHPNTSILANKLRGQGGSSEESVQVDTMQLGESSFLLFTIRDRALIAEQSTGTNALIFFLTSDAPLYQQKQFLFELLQQKQDFQGLPLILVFEKGQNLSIKDVINYFELYKLKDRGSMIKEISLDDEESIRDIFKWIQSQTDKKGRAFNAQPKVVKMKPKYRESVQEQSVKKYEGMLRQKDVKGLPVKKQEQVYIDMEKERIKNQNMQKQLANFNKNKKKMAPYDIKATPNPKIQPNLHFFLKDPKNEKQAEVNIKIQTDQFKELPPPKPYVPKKTGINIATQIQKNELFDFNKQVKPILNILTTKALETASLEIEQEQQFLKMAKYKQAYTDRVKKQKQHEQKNIEEELRIIKQKDKLLEEHRQRLQTKNQIHRKVLNYGIANDFLKDIYKNQCLALFEHQAYPDHFQNQLRTSYLPEIFAKAAIAHKKMLESQSSLIGLFDKDVISPLIQAGQKPKQMHEQLLRRQNLRNTNKSQFNRSVHICYNHHQPFFSNFSKYISRAFDGSLDDFVRGLQQKYQDISDKIQSGELGEQQLAKQKNHENLQFGKNHIGYLINAEKQLLFSSTPNKYQKSTNNPLSNGLLLIDKQFEIIQDLEPGKDWPAYVGKVSNLRNPRERVNMENGLTINLTKVPEEVKHILVYTKVNDVQLFKQEAELKKIKHAAFGVDFYEKNIILHRKNFGEQVKWQELSKTQEGEQPIPNQEVVVLSYYLKRRPIADFWNIQDCFYVSSTFKNEGERKKWFEDVLRFCQKSNQFLKEQQQQQRPVSSKQKTTSRGASRNNPKSKKVIQQPKKKIILKLGSRILEQNYVKLNEEAGLSLLTGQIQQWKQFTSTCENGWELVIKGEVLTSISQLKNYHKVGDLLLRRVPKPQPVKQLLVEQVGEQEQQE